MLPIGGVEMDIDLGTRYRPRRLSTGMVAMPVHWSDNPGHDEAWADRQSARYGGRESPWWLQNMDLELVRSGSPVWPMLRERVHIRIIPHSELEGPDWSVFRALDHGIRHPTCCAWGAVHRNGDVYFFRQFYQTDAPIGLNAKSILERSPEWVQGTVADPSIWRRSDVDMERYSEHYHAAGLTLLKADNTATGYEVLTACFLSSLARWCLGRRDVDTLCDVLHAPSLTSGDAEKLAAHRAVWFAPECAQGERSLYRQCANFRYAPDVGDPLVRASNTRYVDVDDEGPDVVRYMCQSRQVRWVPGGSRRRMPETVDALVREHIADNSRSF